MLKNKSHQTKSVLSFELYTRNGERGEGEGKSKGEGRGKGGREIILCFFLPSERIFSILLGPQITKATKPESYPF